MKTLEEMAEEYLDQDKVACDAINHAAEDLVKDAFIAGYKAAKDQLADTSKVMFCVHCNDMHKGDCAPGKGKNHPALNAKWISVKDRLPQLEYGFAMRRESECVLIASDGNVHVAHLCEKWCDKTQLIFQACDCDCRGHDMMQNEWELDQVTHWQPLPEPPKEKA